MLRISLALACSFALFVFTGCSTPPKETHPPALNPEQAAALLHYNSKAEVWLVHVRKTNPSCGYKLDLPEQNRHPTEIDLNHIVVCGGRPAPIEFDASVSFAYDKDQQKWVISRFSS
jgi:hypothetical protein